MKNWVWYVTMQLRVIILVAVGMIGGLLCVEFLPIWLSSGILAELLLFVLAPPIVRAVTSFVFEMKFRKAFKDNPEDLG